MSPINRVLWTEGLLLEPQHFQQQDRWFEGYVDARSSALGAHAWGYAEVEVDPDLLSLGKLGLRRAAGIFPDGTPFRMPADDPLPEPIDIDENTRDMRVLLVLPLRNDGAVEVKRDPTQMGLFRYRVRETEVRDTCLDSSASALVETGAVSARLALANENLQQYACIPTTQVVELRSDKQVILEETFIPTVLRAGAARRLDAYMTELRGLLQQRAETLAGRAVASAQGGAGEIADFLLLQIVNRNAPLAAHFAESGNIHPERLYEFLIAMAGELATLTLETRRPPQFDPYRHDDLRQSFDAVLETLRKEFRTVREAPAVQIPLEVRGRHGVRVAQIADTSLFSEANFVLSVSASIPAEELRNQFPVQTKIGPVARIADLVNLNLPGIALRALPVAPRQIPYFVDHTYLELDRGGPLWKELAQSGGLALHVAGRIPDLKLSLWAIRGRRT